MFKKQRRGVQHHQFEMFFIDELQTVFEHWSLTIVQHMPISSQVNNDEEAIKIR